jgi:hypothetical protein
MCLVLLRISIKESRHYCTCFAVIHTHNYQSTKTSHIVVQRLDDVLIKSAQLPPPSADLHASPVNPTLAYIIQRAQRHMALAHGWLFAVY